MISNHGGGQIAYSAVISGLEVWCSRDCLGRIAGFFLSEADAVATAEFYSAQITITQTDEPTTDIWVFHATYVVVYPDRNTLVTTRHVAVDPRTERTIGQVSETYDELLVAVSHRPVP